MAIKQLTVFVPNRKGSIVGITDILAKNKINMRALSVAETEDFGILRLIVRHSLSLTKMISMLNICTHLWHVQKNTPMLF